MNRLVPVLAAISALAAPAAQAAPKHAAQPAKLSLVVTMQGACVVHADGSDLPCLGAVYVEYHETRRTVLKVVFSNKFEASFLGPLATQSGIAGSFNVDAVETGMPDAPASLDLVTGQCHINFHGVDDINVDLLTCDVLDKKGDRLTVRIEDAVSKKM
jgi:hypothetical protein